MFRAGSAGSLDLGEDLYLQQADELLVFTNDDSEGLGGEVGNGLEGYSSNGPDAINGHAFSGHTLESSQGDYLNLSCDDIAHLEWLSTFMEDSFSENVGIADALGDNNYSIKDTQFHISSPVSVLESSSCSGKSLPLGPNTFVPGRARSKRPRPASFSPRPLSLISSTSSETSDPSMQSPISPLLSQSDYFAESEPPKKLSKKKKLHQQHADQATSQSIAVRKCMHCGIQKTPQWRQGPLGPKTLCNACGVRYKSGRLFPEYRPAASPTFIASVHSNSHKKVLEMRIKSGEKIPGPIPEFLRKTTHLLESI
ncbi:GATA transcription factor 4-like [Magnolia sinica]|uniref:GATA transcription factor 4-like n=1 Tax=Magnolia sinica TaxID=86752 RepID=UPI002657BBAB|nr:GATA transcription factor 4-like [Magnolia sinica]